MLARIKESGLDAATQAWSWFDTFVGFVPGSMGETSTLACLIGVAVLVLSGVGSWRIMAGMTLGTAAMALLFNALAGKVENLAFAVPFWWHFVLGGWAFGMAFMATDPVSAAYTEKGKWIYGFMIGLMVVLIRVVNPAYPESVMLTILFMNMFAPLIDYFVVQANIKRRMARYAA
jgi:Na+-transporting NADH:ubiquinone oxidoreductase subunit B